MSSIIYQGLFFLFVLLILALPLGWYIKQIMQNNIPKGVRFLQPVEKLFYKIIKNGCREEIQLKIFLSH